VVETITLTNAQVINFHQYTKTETEGPNAGQHEQLDEVSFSYQKITIEHHDGTTFEDDWTM
jgi:type VI protein secretion system component Hcp